jgi:mRNA interferase MazF
VAAYCPDAGDIIWLDFLQPVANEQAGRRSALVLSPRVFNKLTGRCIACPITRRDRDWSFHVPIPDDHEITGVVQADQFAQRLMGAARISFYMQSSGWRA